MWAGLAVLAGLVLAGVWVAYALWDERRWDHHVDSALRLAEARDRHPAARGRCMCRQRVMPDGLSAIETWRGPGEPMLHTRDMCQPLREAM